MNIFDIIPIFKIEQSVQLFYGTSNNNILQGPL